MATATETLVQDIAEEIDLKEPFVKLSKDLKEASQNLTRGDARWLVDMYYTIQDARIRAASQHRKMKEQSEPSKLIDWCFNAQKRFEAAIKTALGEFASSYAVGQWMQAQHGIGPVLSAACLTNFDIVRAPTCGHYWSFAGMNPTAVWAKGTKRPWNAKLKAVLLYRMGECFVKFQNAGKCVYGQYFAQRKSKLWERNFAGEFVSICEKELADKSIGKATEKYKWNSGQFKTPEVQAWQQAVREWEEVCRAGRLHNKLCKEEGRDDLCKLPPKPELKQHGVGEGDALLAPGHIHSWGRRMAVKLFVSHLHEVSYIDYHKKPAPNPWVFEHANEQHTHRIEPPLWPGDYPGRSLTELGSTVTPDKK